MIGVKKTPSRLLKSLLSILSYCSLRSKSELHFFDFVLPFVFVLPFATCGMLLLSCKLLLLVELLWLSNQSGAVPRAFHFICICVLCV